METFGFPAVEIFEQETFSSDEQILHLVSEKIVNDELHSLKHLPNELHEYTQNAFSDTVDPDMVKFTNNRRQPEGVCLLNIPNTSNTCYAKYICDTGATKSVVTTALLSKLFPDIDLQELTIPNHRRVFGADGGKLSTDGDIMLNLALGPKLQIKIRCILNF